MTTRVRRIEGDADAGDVIREAAACLANGGLVVFPTETVYGLGANAADPASVARLRDVKQRADHKPFTVHIPSRTAVTRFVPRFEGLGRRLARKAWPGPLTLIFQVDDVASAPVIQESSLENAVNMYHEGTIGIRCPDDHAAAELLNRAQVPVVAASANAGGAPAPVDGQEAAAALDGKVDLILDAGRTRYAQASTIVRVNHDGYHLVRQGVLDERTVRRLSCLNFLLVCSGNTCRSPMAQGLLRRMLAERIGCAEGELNERGYHVESAGAHAAAGLPASDAAVRILKQRGVDISGHRSQSLALEQINRADHIFVMTEGHLESVRAMVSDARDKSRTVDDSDIEDPVGGSDAVYARSADRIAEALGRRLKEIEL